jgi:hypothetical protein
MYDRYGAPTFLAAYNAGPDRVDAYLADGTPLPDETINYLASVAPRLGSDVAMTGPLAARAGGATAPSSYVADSNRAYAGGGLVQPASYATDPAAAPQDDPSLRAFDGGGLITPAAPTGVLTGQASAVAVQVAQTRPTRPSLVDPMARSGGWGIQVGAFEDPAISRAAIERARSDAGELLVSSQSAVMPVRRRVVLYRARLMGLSATSASAACARLTADGADCFTVPPGS